LNDPNYSDAHFNLAVFYLEANRLRSNSTRWHYFRAIGLPANLEIENARKADPQSELSAR
jgi:hypothetical protein